MEVEGMDGCIQRASSGVFFLSLFLSPLFSKKSRGMRRGFWVGFGWKHSGMGGAEASVSLFAGFWPLERRCMYLTS